MNAITDSLRREDIQANTSIVPLAAHSPDVQKALKRAAKRGTANLPIALEPGWVMVGRTQVAFEGTRAFRL